MESLNSISKSSIVQQRSGEECRDEEKSTPLVSEARIELDGDSILPLEKKTSHEFIDDQPKKKQPMYLFPITRMKLAWTRSSNICDFILKATCVIYSTLGWFFCVGGFPFISLAMLIIGSLYVDDCRLEPKIPIYLIVSGVFGTIQHFIAIWTKYIPKESQGRLKVARAQCRVVDMIIELFLAIWFLLGCIWVYGAYQVVEYRDTFKDEYCNKTLYLFSFWVLNFSFMILAVLIVVSLSCILSVVISPKEKSTDTI